MEACNSFECLLRSATLGLTLTNFLLSLCKRLVSFFKSIAFEVMLLIGMGLVLHLGSFLLLATLGSLSVKAGAAELSLSGSSRPSPVVCKSGQMPIYVSYQYGPAIAMRNGSGSSGSAFLCVNTVLLDTQAEVAYIQDALAAALDLDYLIILLNIRHFQK